MGEDTDRYSSDHELSKGDSSSSRSRSRDSSPNSQKSNKSRKSVQSSDTSAQKEPQQIEQVQVKSKVFDYELVLDVDQLDSLQKKYGENLKNLVDKFKLDAIENLSSKQSSQLKGVLISVISQSREAKYKTVDSITNSIYDIEGKELSLIILIPESMVSLLIGKRGKQINQIKEESGAGVIANQPISGMSQRTIEITGKPKNISKAVDIIYNLLGERAGIVEQPTKLPTQANFEDIIIRSRFPLQYNFKSFLQGQEKNGIRGEKIRLLDSLQKQYKTRLFFEKKRPYYINNDEVVMEIEGKLHEITSTLTPIFQLMREYYDNIKRRSDFLTKILIPSKYTTKLIGKEGCMISDIAKQSDGAKIKIISNKNDKQSKKECVIEVSGNIDSKLKACLIIIEKIEQFKHGGPILKDSKALKENLSSQFQNSVYDTSQVNYQQLRLEKEYRSRSRSQDRFEKERRYAGYNPAFYTDQYFGAGRSRSRERYERREFYDRDRERDREYEKDRFYRDNGSRYRERDFELSQREREVRDRELRERDFRDQRRFEQPKRERRDSYKRSESPTLRKKPEEHNQKLKIPIILTNNLISEFKQEDNKILKQIMEQTGCKISIEKEKRLVLNGTVEANTNAFKKIQTEFLKIESE